MAADSLYDVDVPEQQWAGAVDRLMAFVRPSSARPDVAVVRGFTRRSAERAAVLRARLDACGVSAVEMGPEVGSCTVAARLCVVLTDAGESAWSARRLAAREGIPLLRLGTEGRGGVSRSEAEQVLLYTVFDTDGGAFTDAALARIAVQPLRPRVPRLRVALDGATFRMRDNVELAVTADGEGGLTVTPTPAAMASQAALVGHVAEFVVARGSYRVSVDGSATHDLHEEAALRVVPGTVRLVEASFG